MTRQGFDNQKYLTMQSQHIQERIAQFGGKLYLEFGGKLFDDYHASRVLPGFAPDSKVKFVRVEDGVYDRGFTKRNKPEGDALVAEVIRRLSDPSARKSSLGIVTFSNVQKDYIERRLTAAIAEKRLEAIREFAEFNSGFRIAMRDLEIRGAGNLLGPQQSGHLANIGYDLYCKLLEEAVTLISQAGRYRE